MAEMSATNTQFGGVFCWSKGLLVQEILFMPQHGEPFIWFGISCHSRTEPFEGYIICTTCKQESQKLATLGHDGSTLAHQFPCYSCWTGLTVTKNRIGLQRQVVPVPWVGDKGYPVTVVQILFFAHCDI